MPTPQPSRGGCLHHGYATTAAKQLGDSEITELDMREAGYEPLEPDRGAARPWRCRHMPCGNTVTPRLDKFRRGEGCCAHCASYGFNLTKPAIVYVLHHERLGAVKVSTGSTDRTDKFSRNGWMLVQTADFATGAAARALEQGSFETSGTTWASTTI
jgi:hypothetical protein